MGSALLCFVWSRDPSLFSLFLSLSLPRSPPRSLSLSLLLSLRRWGRAGGGGRFGEGSEELMSIIQTHVFYYKVLVYCSSRELRLCEPARLVIYL